MIARRRGLIRTIRSAKFRNASECGWNHQMEITRRTVAGDEVEYGLRHRLRSRFRT